MSEYETLWITRYALSDGIKEKRCKIDGNGFATADGNPYVYYSPGDWFRSPFDAADDAEQRRIKKIASLKKQIAKLEALRFK